MDMLTYPVVVLLLQLLLVKKCWTNQVLYHCSFETNEDCRLEQDPSDDFDWQVHRGMAPFISSKRGHLTFKAPVRKRETYRSESFPMILGLIREVQTDEHQSIFIDLPPIIYPGGHFVDHTYGNQSGHFAHLVARDGVRSSGHARIMSPPITTQDSIEADLTFFYHLWNIKPSPSAGKLNVFACEGRDLVFSASATVGSVWMKAEVRIKCNGTFRIIFDGFIGSKDTDIAIDDVNVTVCNGTPTVHPNIPRESDNDTHVNNTGFPSTTPSMTKQSNPSDPEVGPNGPGTGVDPETAVSLVVTALVLFAATCFMLLITLMIHIRFRSKRRRRGRFHEPLTFSSEFFNRHSLDPSEATAYMTLNFPPSSTSGSGVEFLSLSERPSSEVRDSKRSKPSSGFQSKCSSSVLDASVESIRRSIYARRSTVGQRRQSRTFPATKEFKNLGLLESVQMRRFRTLSQHLSVTEVENLRRTLCNQDDTVTNSDRTVSTLLLDTSATSIRPGSSMSDHFYYSLFPSTGIVSCKNSLVACEESAHLEEIDNRPCSGDYDSDDLEVQAVTSGSLLNTSMSRSATGSDTSVAPETTEMVDNEIYECFTNSESSSTETVQ